MEWLRLRTLPPILPPPIIGVLIHPANIYCVEAHLIRAPNREATREPDWRAFPGVYYIWAAPMREVCDLLNVPEPADIVPHMAVAEGQIIERQDK